MKAIEILQDCNRRVWDMDECDEAIQEIKTLQQELKQGQENYDKLWDMYSELKKEKEIKMTRELIIEVYLRNPPKVVAEMLYDTITRYEKELKQGQDNYDKLWDLYSELKRENQSLKKSNTYTYKQKENK